MKFKLQNRNITDTETSVASDRTHRLNFTEVMEPNQPTMMGPSNFSVSLTEAEAKAYTYGTTYEFELVPTT